MEKAKKRRCTITGVNKHRAAPHELAKGTGVSLPSRKKDFSSRKGEKGSNASERERKGEVRTHLQHSIYREKGKKSVKRTSSLWSRRGIEREENHKMAILFSPRKKETTRAGKKRQTGVLGRERKEESLSWVAGGSSLDSHPEGERKFLRSPEEGTLFLAFGETIP